MRISVQLGAAGRVVALLACATLGLACGPGNAATGSGGASAPPPGGDGASSVRVPDGRVLYGRFCQSCHGDAGTGDGPGAALLTVKPRDFSQGKFKFRSTTGPMPSDADLIRTISRGIPGTEMSAYAQLPDDSKQALVEQVKSLTVGRIPVDGESELAELGAVGSETIDGKLHARVNWFRYHKVGDAVLVPPPPPASDELLALGRALFLDDTKGGCAKCHGPGGLGDGPSATDLKDDWGFPIRPRNLTSEPFKGGRELQDLYLRVVSGIPGTPMPSAAGTLPTEQERWAVVYHVARLAKLGVGGGQ